MLTCSSRSQHLAGERGLRARHDRAEDERAEDGVDADRLGGARRQQQPDEHHASTSGVRRPAAPVAVVSRASSGRTTTNITSAYTAVSSRIVPKPAERAAHRDRDDDGEQRPRHDVVDRRAGERQHADRRAVHAAFGEDPRQHRERRDRHRGAEEQRERERRHGGASAPATECAG